MYNLPLFLCPLPSSPVSRLLDSSSSTSSALTPIRSSYRFDTRPSTSFLFPPLPCSCYRRPCQAPHYVLFLLPSTSHTRTVSAVSPRSFWMHVPLRLTLGGVHSGSSLHRSAHPPQRTRHIRPTFVSLVASLSSMFPIEHTAGHTTVSVIPFPSASL